MLNAIKGINQRREESLSMSGDVIRALNPSSRIIKDAFMETSMEDAVDLTDLTVEKFAAVMEDTDLSEESITEFLGGV